ncbi:hypothetical protein HCN44_001407 [Aphidius gifuensis]|uniref:Voltage-dependent calcium channel gamma-5 subunit n=1 Tax=Aphidius gifuensis TaxID=684658 RepID=A0A834XT36_APHGI|nr:voltage-dependent calcium channel gamma-3 subunit [Aphidius gifuensis]KAF7992082.1 hypothetical protein HCN44_001407 [Aphidius gifuensis]
MSCYTCCLCCCEPNKIDTLTYGPEEIRNHQDSSKGLAFLSGFTALLSFVIVSIAIGTDEWLFTDEKLSKINPANASVEPDSKITHSGLWRICVATSPTMQFECSRIDYFPNEEYLPDPSDSTMAIPYAVTKSAVFFIIATVLLMIAEIFYVIAYVSRPRLQLCIFVAGVIFTICGLMMLVGMIMYISVFKAEVGSKLRPRSSFQGPPFTYNYGFSFLLYVSGFITTEIAGTSAIFLYISWHQRDLAREILEKSNIDDGYDVTSSAQRRNTRSRQSRGSFLCERHQKRYFFGRESTEDQIDFDDFLPLPASLDYDEFPRQFPRDITSQTV